MNRGRIGLTTATSIVIANMIGTGVFTSLGFQAAGLHQGMSIMLLWLIGGLVAYTGALCYAGLGTAMPRSGGEYTYLGEMYHPSVGFAAGWVSVTVGFAAPVAAACMAFSEYFHRVFPVVGLRITAIAVLAGVTIIQAASLKAGSKLQNYATAFKVSTIILLIMAGFIAASQTHSEWSFAFDAATFSEIRSTAFTTSFFFVSLAYSGWNAAAYIASDMKNPKLNIPKALLRGTMLVMFLYISLNLVFMLTTPASEMIGPYGPVVDIAGLAAVHIFGATGGLLMSGLIALLLISTISAMTMAGPRVTQEMGNKHFLFSFFSKYNQSGVPSRAIFLQSCLSLFFIITASFQQVVIYIAFTLNLFTFMSVLGMILFRKKILDAGGYETPTYPMVPLLFLTLTGWMLFFGFKSNPVESLWGIATALTGIPVYFLSKFLSRKNPFQKPV